LNAHRSFCTCIGVVAAAFLLCKILGWDFCAVQSGSMEPTIPTYSVCLVSTHVSYDGLKAGDIVVYERESDNKRIIHRVTEITPEGIVTQGDANLLDDGVSVTPENLYARYVGHIPYLAHFANLFHSPFGICIIIGSMILLYAIEIVESKQKKS